MLQYQPQGRAIIDRSNPITRGLIFAALPDSLVNLIDSVPLVPIFSPTTTIRQSGKVLKTGAYGYPAPASSLSPEAKLFDVTANISALIVGDQDGLNNNNWGLYRSNGSNSPTWGIGFHSGASASGPYAQVGGFLYRPATNIAPTVRGVHCALITADGAFANVYQDGQVIVSSTSYTAGTAPLYGAASRRQVQFGTVDGLGNLRTIRPSLGLVWNRALTTSEAISITTNPWQVFISPEEDWDIVVAADGGITVVSASGQSVAIANTGAASKSIFPASGLASGNASTLASTVSVYFANASSIGSAAVAGSSSSIAPVTTITDSSGASIGTAIAAAVSRAIYSTGGSTSGAASNAANAVIIAVAHGIASGSGSAVANVVAIFNTNGATAGVSEIDAIASAVFNAVGHSNGSARVVGTTTGGLHYTAEGDRFRVTIVFSKYAAAVKGSPYRVKFKE